MALASATCKYCGKQYQTNAGREFCADCYFVGIGNGKPYGKKKQPPTTKYNPSQHWYEVTAGEFPHMSVNNCGVCKKTVSVGDVVYIDKKQARVGSEVEQWFIMHKDCMRDVLNSAPDSEFDRIQARLAEGGPLFDARATG